MAQQKEYYAFISYKREDEKWAKWLQDKLEHYKFPTNLNGRTNLPKRIRPTFRDVTDLNPGLLAEEINNALRNSEWLIVVCSPLSAKSPWVCKEAQTFIDLEREDHIIPFVIEGKPFSNDTETECYPEALLNLTGSKELLAANINEMGRDAAAIKVVASMFNLRFDALWQRHEREQRRKKWMWIVVVILISLLALGIGGYFVKQNITIERQNVQLKKYVSNLLEANNTFSLLKNNKKQYSLAGELRGNGCKDYFLMNFDYHPYEPIVAFSDNWGFWLHYLNSGIEILLSTGGCDEPVANIATLCFSNDGSELMAVGMAGVFVWSVENHKLIHHGHGHKYTESEDFKRKYPHYNEDDFENEEMESFEKYNYNCAIEYNNGLINIIDKDKNKTVCTANIGDNSTYRCIFNPKYKEILFIAEKKAALYDDSVKRFVLFFNGYNNADDIEFSKNGEYLRIENIIYERNAPIDTIKISNYSLLNNDKLPNLNHKDNHLYDEVTCASIKLEENKIIYRRGTFVKDLEVIRTSNTGSGQEYLSDALFAGSDRIVAIVEQGNFRVYNTSTWTLVGTLDNYVWNGGMDVCMRVEQELSHASSYIVLAEYIDKKLYVLSSGGIIRVYNVDKCRLDTVIELPRRNDELNHPIENCFFSSDGSKIFYSFEGEPFYYICELPNNND